MYLSNRPVCWIIAGPDDPRRTTFALDRTDCFLNSGEAPEIVFTQEGELREDKLLGLLRILESAGGI